MVLWKIIRKSLFLIGLTKKLLPKDVDGSGWFGNLYFREEIKYLLQMFFYNASIWKYGSAQLICSKQLICKGNL